MISRAAEFAVALLALLFLFPLFAVVGFLVILDSKGPVFFLQERIGLNQKPFTIVKFRTMVAGAVNLGGHSTARGDVRVTRIGKLLRKTSIDELPQLINVVTGTMSFVGPRPDLLKQLCDYSAADLRSRLSVKPGITGLAQAVLRSAATAEERLALDLEYVARKSVVFDLKILAKTGLQVISKGSF